MEDQVRTIRICRSEKCIEVQTNYKKKYYIRPKFKNYLDVVQKVGEKQLSQNKPIGAYELLQIFSENREHVGKLEPYQRHNCSWPRKVGSIYAYWVQKFTSKKYWVVTDRRGKIFPDEISSEILRVVFQHSGSEERAVYWLGDISEVHIELEGDYFSESAPLGTATLSTVPDVDKDRNATTEWKRFCRYCNNLLEYSLSRLKHKYDPELYVPRQEIEGQFSDFLKSQRNLFLILGKSGTGKTNLVCHLAKASSFPVLLLSGEFYPAQGFSLRNEIEEGLKPLGVCFLSVMNVIGWIHHLAAKNHALFIIYLDALNEFTSPVAVLQELAAIVSQYGAVYPSIKFCVTCRTISWDSLMNVAPSLLPYLNLYIPKGCVLLEPILNQVFLTSVALGDFNKYEFETALEKYRARARFKGQLVYEEHELCHRPLILRLVSKIWAGKDLPEDIDACDLWDSYWNTIVTSGPKGVSNLMLEIASTMRHYKATTIRQEQIEQLQYYSGEKLQYLLSSDVLNLAEDKYERNYSFSHERLLEYTLGRGLLEKSTATIRNIPDLLTESVTFPTLTDAIVFFAEMVAPITCWQLIDGLVAVGNGGDRLACRIIAELQLTSDEIWEILETLSKKGCREIMEPLLIIGTTMERKTATLLAKLIRKKSHWDFEDASFIGKRLEILCEESEYFLRLSEKYLKMGNRFKQVSLIALSELDGYDKWNTFRKNIFNFSSNRDVLLRQALAYSISSLAHHDTKTAEELIKLMVEDTKEEVRYHVAWSLVRLLREDIKWTGILEIIAGSDNWCSRQVAAAVIGSQLSNKPEKYRDLAERISTDANHHVRKTLLETTLASFDHANKLMNTRVRCILKAIVLLSSHEDLEYISLVSYSHHIITDLANQWFQHNEPKIREFVARIWKSDVEKSTTKIAVALASDPITYVRCAFADRLKNIGCWVGTDNEQRVFHIIKNLSKDPSPFVRTITLSAISFYATLYPDKCVSLLTDWLKKEKNKMIKDQITSHIREIDHKPSEGALYDVIIYFMDLPSRLNFFLLVNIVDGKAHFTLFNGYWKRDTSK